MYIILFVLFYYTINIYIIIFKCNVKYKTGYMYELGFSVLHYLLSPRLYVPVPSPKIRNVAKFKGS